MPAAWPYRFYVSLIPSPGTSCERPSRRHRGGGVASERGSAGRRRLQIVSRTTATHPDRNDREERLRRVAKRVDGEEHEDDRGHRNRDEDDRDVAPRRVSSSGRATSSAPASRRNLCPSVSVPAPRSRSPRRRSRWWSPKITRLIREDGRPCALLVGGAVLVFLTAMRS